MKTVKPELEKLSMKLEVRWPDLPFFNAEGGLNEYGEIARSYLELEEKKEAVAIVVVDCLDKHHYHIKLSAKSPNNAMVCGALTDIYKKGGSVCTKFFDAGIKHVKEVTIQLVKES